jgi:probable phosphoglycerate mutase
MNARIILVRHGETEAQSSIRYYGRTDVRLSELGRRQMAATAVALREHRFQSVFASSLSRAVEGARIIAGAQAEIFQLEEFVEIDFGSFEGLTREEIAEKYPVEFERWLNQRLDADYAYPGGESRSAFGARITAGWQRLLGLWKQEGSGGADALFVAHRGVIRALMRQVANVEPIIELGSIQILERSADGWRASATDLTGHLK